MIMFRNLFYFSEESEKIWLSPEVSDSSRCLVFFTDTVWIVEPLGQAISFKSFHNLFYYELKWSFFQWVAKEKGINAHKYKQ